MMKLQLQFFGGRGSAGGNNPGRSAATEKQTKSSSVVNTEEDIDKLKFRELGDGFDYTLSSGDSEVGDVKINRETFGGYSITYHNEEGIEDVDVVEDLNTAKGVAREFLKGKWRTIYG